MQEFSQADFEKQAKKAEKLIQGSQRILVSLHRRPDGDSLASCLAVYDYLASLGKKVSLISPSSIPQNFNYLPNFEKIGRGDIFDLNLKDFDLIINLDIPNFGFMTEKIEPPTLEYDCGVINIDHHQTNQKYGEVNLVKADSSSTCEVLYDLFLNWGVKIDPELSEIILAGIVSDTGVFQYPNVSDETLKKASELIGTGADLRKIIFNFTRRKDFEEMKFWGLALQNLSLSKSGRYVSVLISHKEFEKNHFTASYHESAAGMFLQVLEGTDFGYILVEDKPRGFHGSLRARTDFDVSQVAKALGGGGHKGAAGFTLSNCSLQKAQDKVERVISWILSKKD